MQIRGALAGRRGGRRAAALRGQAGLVVALAGAAEEVPRALDHRVLGRERLDAVTPESVHAAASKYLVPSNRTVGWFEPIR